MANKIDHVQVLNKKVTALSDALAHLGKGTDLHELIEVLRRPGWTTPAEFAFAETIIDTIQNQVTAISKLSGQLLNASKIVGKKEM